MRNFVFKYCGLAVSTARKSCAQVSSLYYQNNVVKLAVCVSSHTKHIVSGSYTVLFTQPKRAILSLLSKTLSPNSTEPITTTTIYINYFVISKGHYS